MVEITTATFIGKVVFATIFGAILALACSSCGFTTTGDGVTIGTSSFLATTLEGRRKTSEGRFGAPLDDYSKKDKKRLSRLMK